MFFVDYQVACFFEGIRIFLYFCGKVNIMILIADSGSTKTDWVLADGRHVVRQVLTQGINPFHQDRLTVENIVAGELLPKLGAADVKAVYYYGSGCREEFIPMMADIFTAAFSGAEHVEVNGDLLGAARAVCGRDEGIACILGTGANSGLYDGVRITGNTPPLGYILGDEGSGAVLGRMFVNAIFKGGLPKSLRDEYLSITGQTMADIIRRVYREPLANRYLASMSCFIAGRLDVPSLRSMVIENFRSFFSRNVVQYCRPDLPVGAVGSIAYYFRAELEEAAGVEGFTVGKVMRSPLEGLVAFHGGK